MAPVRTHTHRFYIIESIILYYLLFVLLVLRVRYSRRLCLGANDVIFFSNNYVVVRVYFERFRLTSRLPRSCPVRYNNVFRQSCRASLFVTFYGTVFFRSKSTAPYVFFFCDHRANVNCVRSVGRYDCGSWLARKSS